MARKKKVTGIDIEEFFDALDLLVKEGKCEEEKVSNAIQDGIASAYKKEFGEQFPIKVVMNKESRSVSVYGYMKVVDKVIDDDTEIWIEDAKKIKADAQLGEMILIDINPAVIFGRISSQAAKQVVLQRLNDEKKERINKEMSGYCNEIVPAVIRRVDGGFVYVEITATQMEGVMSRQDQVRTETYNVGDRIKVFVKHIKEHGKALQVIVSRSAPGFVRRLFENEVPEIKAGLVKIKNVVREAGFRTKMSVYSDDINIDPVGACIGQKGLRINSVVQELNGEKIDVIQYTDDIQQYITHALSPAKILMIMLDEENKKAEVIVEDEQLSLAIGKSGQNARLAAKLTEWRIDVKQYSSYSKEIESSVDLPKDIENFMSSEDSESVSSGLEELLKN